ncbi:nardilysin [Euwallacea similis]|uniref:nardilysin n=1 Tax=Euwallacea similis TaxID=1736056 RepID=UPI00344FF088
MCSCLTFYRYHKVIFKKKIFEIMNKTIKANAAGLKSLVFENKQKNTTLNPNNSYEVLVPPTKSESDKKEYRVIKLANGLTACLISDTSPITENIEDSCEESETGDSSAEDESETDGSRDESVEMEDNEHEEDPRAHHPRHEQKLAAAGLCIGVGSFSDPKEVPGMAHFLEHMVFMGSAKYPKENSFDEFIKLSGGSDNASTDAETTVFYFECLEKHFEEALDRFSQFYKEPLMKQEAMTRERQAIESEFQMSVPSDSSRKEQLLCCLAKKGSPVNSFPWGNLITLRDNIKDEDLYKGVYEFRKRHYSAHRMTLAVQARISLENLEEIILKHFSEVPNNNLPPDDYAEFIDVFNTPEFNKIYHINPVKDLCQIDITWAFPSLKHKYRSKPQHFLSHLLGDEGKGSLLSYLKKKCWVLGTNIGNAETGTEHNSLFTLFTVSLSLTDEGYNHLNEVIEAVFSYLAMLKKTGPSRRIFDEAKSISDISFRYAHEETAVENVENLCEVMQLYPSEDYLTGTELYFEFEPKAIEELIDLMTPETANYMILKRQPENKTKEYQTEKWFGTNYLVKEIPGSWMENWKKARIIPDLSLPPPNSFITTDFNILPHIENNPEYPQKILEKSSVELWYRGDTKFKLPMAHYNFYFISSLALSSCKNASMLDVLVNLLAVEMAEDVYPATTADLFHNFVVFEKGLIVKVWGFSEKLPLLVNLIVKHLTTLSSRITENMFKAIKVKLLQSYHNKALKPSVLAKELRLNLVVENSWTSIDRYAALQEIYCEDIKTFAKDYFKSLYVKVLVQGNVSQNTAVETVHSVVKTLNFVELKEEEKPQFKIARVNKGERCCRIRNINASDTNSVITNYYQSDLYTVASSVIVDLIVMAIEEPLFDILRTKEQLGYHVYCSVRDTFGVLGFTITVNAQTTKASTKHVNERIEEFLKHTKSLLENMDHECFEKLKENLIKIKQCSDVHLKEEVDRNWGEITGEDYLFDRIKLEIEATKQTNLKTICSWWENHNQFGSHENFRKLSIQIEGNNAECTDEESKLEIAFLVNEDEAAARGDDSYFIKTIQEYKDSVSIYHIK